MIFSSASLRLIGFGSAVPRARGCFAKIWSWRGAFRALELCLLAALLSACTGNGVLSPRGPIAEANKAIMLNSLAIMLAIVVPTILAVFMFAWWFRAGNARARYDPEFVFSGRIEAIVWGIPLLTVIFLGGLIWIGSHQLDPYRRISSTETELEVQAVSLDWKWLFIYPQEGVASVNWLVLPVGRPVHFSLTSSSVMNSFFVPQLGSQIYTMYGMATQLSLRADHAGVYRGQSSHFSGDGFAKMVFPVHAVPPDEFALWAANARETGPTLDARTYSVLARQSQGDPPVTFAAVQPGLFDAIVRQELPPGPGPQHGRGGAPQISPKGER